jgi:starch synthase
MACGLPVVATAVGGVPEIVIEGVTGHLVPLTGRGSGLGAALAEKVNAVLDNPSAAREMGRAGRQRVLDDFTWRAVAARTAELYRSLL